MFPPQLQRSEVGNGQRDVTGAACTVRWDHARMHRRRRIEAEQHVRSNAEEHVAALHAPDEWQTKPRPETFGLGQVVDVKRSFVHALERWVRATHPRRTA